MNNNNPIRENINSQASTSTTTTVNPSTSIEVRDYTLKLRAPVNNEDELIQSTLKESEEFLRERVSTGMSDVTQGIMELNANMEKFYDSLGRNSTLSESFPLEYPPEPEVETPVTTL